jgi:regulation of enolase protein 1 (concanavalin A-like superfamily)
MKSMLVIAACLALILVVGGAGSGGNSKSLDISAKGWGGIIDPDGDCKFTIEKGRLRMSLPGTDHSLAFERGQMNAPRTLRSVEGDFIAQVEVSGSFPAGAASLVSTRRPFHGAGLLLWLDEKNYVRLERSKLVFEGENMSYANFECRTDGEFIRKGDATEHPLSDGTTHLRLERCGDKLYGYVSSNGVDWTAMELITTDLPKRVLIGVAAGHNTSSPFEPEFRGFKVFTQQDE